MEILIFEKKTDEVLLIGVPGPGHISTPRKISNFLVVLKSTII